MSARQSLAESLRRLFARSSNAVIGPRPVSKIVHDLDRLRQELVVTAKAQFERHARLRDGANKALDESDRATRVAAKVADLIS